MVDFELLCPPPEKALSYGDGAKGDDPPYDPVAMFKVLIPAAGNTVRDTFAIFLTVRRLARDDIPKRRKRHARHSSHVCYDVTPAFHPAATRDRPLFEGPPVSHPT